MTSHPKEFGLEPPIYETIIIYIEYYTTILLLPHTGVCGPNPENVDIFISKDEFSNKS